MKELDRNKLNRREALELLGTAGMAFVVGCGSSPTSPTTTITTGGGTDGAASCAVTPSETAGPYPNRLGMLNNPAYFRQDITEGKSGIPLTLNLTLVNVNSSCAAVANAAVEIWQCDATGNYSEYSQSAGQTFLRGLQTTDSNGNATFRTIYPGWYSGRATHIHVEVYMNGSTVKITQIAFPEEISAAVYRTTAYASHGQNSTTNAHDNVFSDGTDHEMATVSGDSTSGYTASLTLGVAL